MPNRGVSQDIIESHKDLISLQREMKNDSRFKRICEDAKLPWDLKSGYGIRPESRGNWRSLPSRRLIGDDHSAAQVICTDHDPVSVTVHHDASCSSPGGLSLDMY